MFAFLQLSFVSFAFNVYRTITVDNLLDTLLDDPTVYADFEFLGFWQMQYNNMVALVVFFAWVKIFKYIRYNIHGIHQPKLIRPLFDIF